MAAVHRLKQQAAATEAPGLSPERIALGVRIEASKAASAAVLAAASAYQIAEAATSEAHRTVEAAEAAVEQAKVDAGTYLAAVAGGTAGARPTTIREARAALQDAQDGLDAALSARNLLRSQMTPGNGAPEMALMRLRDAAVAVLTVEAATSAAALVAEVEALQRQLAERGSALNWLATETGIFARGTFGGFTDPGVGPALARLTTPPCSWGGLGDAHDAGRARWQDALAALMVDAQAELP
jgi:hypothetical protein